MTLQASGFLGTLGIQMQIIRSVRGSEPVYSVLVLGVVLQRHYAKTPKKKVQAVSREECLRKTTLTDKRRLYFYSF